MKVLLIQPLSATIRGLPQAPLALMYIGGYAEKNGHTVKILDRNFETNSKQIITQFAPDIVGITSLTGKTILDGIAVSRYIKKHMPHVPIVWGGVHASILPRSTLENPFVDFVIIGEGEDAFNALLHCLETKGNLNSIPQLAFKEHNALIINDIQPPKKHMDSLILLPWHLVDVSRYTRHETLLITSRGCPHRCEFCYAKNYHAHQWRAMSPERVRQEITHAQKFHTIKRFRFDDDNFCADMQRAYAIIDSLPRNIPVYFECRVDYIEEKFVALLSTFKEVFIFLGVESGNDTILKKMNKGFTAADTRKAFALLNAYGIKTSASFIIGYPDETPAQLQDTLRLITEIQSTRPSCCIFTPFPGSPLMERLIHERIIHPPHTLEEWGAYSDSEQAHTAYFSTSYARKLNAIYQSYWRKFIYTFILNFRWRWVIIGAANYACMQCRALLRLISGDIRWRQENTHSTYTTPS